MKKICCFSRLSNRQLTLAMNQRIAGVIGVAILTMVGVAAAQNPTPDAPLPQPGSQMTAPNGYTIHQSVDVGGRIASISGSNAMYDTLDNLHSGPRAQGMTFEMRALPGKKGTPIDSLKAFGAGFGGDPNNFAKLDFSKGKLYEFAGLFRRDRQYFDYDLLGNPNIPSGYSIPISGSTTPYAWPQVRNSPFMFNTVRRMTDTNLTLLPLSKVTFRFAYSQNIFQGPSQTPSGNSVAGSEVILQEYQRNSTDDFTGAVDWKPLQGTKLTYEEQIDHYKGNSYFTMAPQYFTVQEANGTPVALLANYQNFYPYGYSSSTGVFTPSSVCSSSIVSSSTILYANPSGGLPIIDPSCNVITSYFRSQPTREIFPTEIFQLQSSSIKNISMNGNVRYTSANMNLPNYYENFQGLYNKSSTNVDRELAYAGYANAKREAISVDYGIVWEATKTVSLSDQVSYSNVHQPGTSEFTSGTGLVIASTTAKTFNNSTLSSCAWTTGATPVCTPTLPVGVSAPSSPLSTGAKTFGTPQYGYFAQRFMINNATVTWDATARATLSLTYRYRTHVIGEGASISGAVPTTCPNSDDGQAYCGTVTINENGGIFNVALRPTNNWDVNGTVEMLYDDNVFTPISPRQTQHYRVHTLYRAKPWATISGAYNDLERHNNTNNTGSTSAAGSLDHVDHSRVLSLGADLTPNEHYGLDVNYAYSDVYTSTNSCYLGVATVMPGSTNAPAPAPSSTSVTSCPGESTEYGPVKDFEDAPTQYGSVALALSPIKKLHSDIGYRISSVNGSRLFTDARDVDGSLVSAYQTPFVKAAWTVHTGLILKVEYNYFGYGEGGRSGAQWCNTSTTIGTMPVACSSVPNTSMYASTPVYGFTAPRNFHANNVTLGVHYEF